MLLLSRRNDDSQQSANINLKGGHETNTRKSGDLNVIRSQLLTPSMTWNKV